MSKFFYHLADATNIDLWTRHKRYTKADLEQDSLDYADLLALTDNEKSLVIAGSRVYKSVDDFNEKIDLQKQKIDEIISYWDYTTAVTSFDRITGNFVTPDSVYDVCGEDVTNVASRTIDENTGTFWQHDDAGPHSITFDIGRSLQEITAVRIALGGADSDAHKLTSVDVYVSDNVDNFGDAVGTGLDFQTLGVWNSQNITAKQGRYIKLDNISTLDASNYIRIREVEFTHQITGF